MLNDDEIEKAGRRYLHQYKTAPLGDAWEARALDAYVAGWLACAEQMHHEKIDNYVEGVNDGVEFEREEKAKIETEQMGPKWISVRERLPEAEGYFWIWDGKVVFLADFNPDCVSSGDDIFPSYGFSIGEDDLEDAPIKWKICEKPEAPEGE